MSRTDTIKIKAGAWVVVCDGQKALILVNEGGATFPKLRTHEVHAQDNLPSRAQGTDAPGRVHQSSGSARSSVEATDWHEEAERAFLRRIADRLEAAVVAGETRSVVVVAPPRALGVLRPLYGRALAAAVEAEIDRDLVKLLLHAIEQHLAG
ncbi:protein required for attachment to host cells [Angulomicrobium tetraedrale]|uniref:Protein required for attachment to host cells n=1 Tax=Ancylobacter tetraedralis TaxID=217068 RepID=A0A839Z6Z3_9HYPH|nr:host attachment family protein [Ancylobacter tetraedralis]MBB3770833.1 protein required for attachment to host cells [Ancylobacter tetraedralis]